MRLYKTKKAMIYNGLFIQVRLSETTRDRVKLYSMLNLFVEYCPLIIAINGFSIIYFCFGYTLVYTIM